MDLLERSDDEQLEAHALEELEGERGSRVRAAAEGLVDDHETKRARAPLPRLEPELVGEARCQDRVRELLLLSAGLTAGIGVVLMLAVVLPPAFGCREDGPVPHVRDLPRPATVELCGAFSSPEAIDDPFDLDELSFGIGLVFGPG